MNCIDIFDLIFSDVSNNPNITSDCTSSVIIAGQTYNCSTPVATSTSFPSSSTSTTLVEESSSASSTSTTLVEEYSSSSSSSTTAAEEYSSSSSSLTSL